MKDVITLSRDLQDIQERSLDRNSIPFLTFKEHWEVRISFPFYGAAARFLVRKKGSCNCVSVYLDTTDSLGFVGEPYYEIYPNKNGDNERFLLDEESISCMMSAIEESLDWV